MAYAVFTNFNAIFLFSVFTFSFKFITRILKSITVRLQALAKI